jgi:hypothetical protein
MPGILRKRMDDRREIFPVAKPDVDDLDALQPNGDDAPRPRCLSTTALRRHHAHPDLAR